MEYYIFRNNVQSGPFPASRLLSEGLTPETPVWREGMPQWAKASTLPELAYLFNNVDQEESAFGSYAQNPADYAPHSHQYAPGGQYRGYVPPVQHTNWLPWAIVATVFGFLCSCIGLIFGIIGIVNANKANTYFATGQETLGLAANSSAKTWTIVALVIGGIGLITSIVTLATTLSLPLAALVANTPWQ